MVATVIMIFRRINGLNFVKIVTINTSAWCGHVALSETDFHKMMMCPKN